MNRRLALKVFKLDKETSFNVNYLNKSPHALTGTWDYIFSNSLAIGLYLLLPFDHKLLNQCALTEYDSRE